MSITNPQIHREITPLSTNDCLLVFDRMKQKFDFPVHFHPEYELNYISRAPKATRIVGNHLSQINELELVLTGPNLQHGWQQGECTSDAIHEVTIQFHRDLLQADLLNRNIMLPIQKLLERAKAGVAFSAGTIQKVQPMIERMASLDGFHSLIELIELLHELGNSPDQLILSSLNDQDEDFYNSEKIKTVLLYVQQNYMHKIKVSEVAGLVNMTEVTFGRFMKQRTGKSFVEFLNDTRIGFASRLLIENKHSISEIAWFCGFNNQANFNRIFKKYKDSTPSEYRENFAGTRRVN
ncbi:AraC family transcriptional regulator [Mangrovibacterium lignilyticum]|uniref:AraC family transcriptional regulator n=1 Tax=Mangrovibacterium lignilyticum TaxID=2668052 RepID=UPI0013D1F4DD|nr:AraC family transcriptional regulator [Mangrovibacterium lignilyticum]